MCYHVDELFAQENYKLMPWSITWREVIPMIDPSTDARMGWQHEGRKGPEHQQRWERQEVCTRYQQLPQDAKNRHLPFPQICYRKVDFEEGKLTLGLPLYHWKNETM